MSAARAAYRTIEDQWSDPRWRLNNLYVITDKQGRAVSFRMNWAQESLFDDLHYLNVILKARQLGFTTFIQLFMLDASIWIPNIRCGTIAHTLDDAETIFRDKVKFPYEQLDEGIKAANPAVQDSAKTLTFANNSSIRVGTSLRSGTLQYLHVSEHGKICAKYPDKAREIRTGAFNTVQAGQVIFVESTAEGREGDFHDICERARNLDREGKRHTELDFKFHFFPWWREPAYRLSPDGVTITAEHERYFTELAQKGIQLTAEQRAWYVKKAETQEEDMLREFPATPEEAFEASVEGAYFATQMARVRADKRIGRIPILTSIPVDTYWDLGRDTTAVWFRQRVHMENRFIDYYENSGEGLAHYWRVLQERRERHGFVFGTHYAPHDMAVEEWAAGKSRVEQAAAMGLKFEVVPRVADKMDAIEAARNILSTCYFDEERCSQGIAHLDGYRKEWDDARGVWKDRPRHDAASHGADSFMTFALADEPRPGFGGKLKYKPSGVI